MTRVVLPDIYRQQLTSFAPTTPQVAASVTGSRTILNLNEMWFSE